MKISGLIHCTYMYRGLNIYMYIHVCTCVYIYTSTCMNITCVHVHVYTYGYMYVKRPEHGNTAREKRDGEKRSVLHLY